jgi:hypothetical protein
MLVFPAFSGWFQIPLQLLLVIAWKSLPDFFVLLLKMKNTAGIIKEKDVAPGKNKINNNYWISKLQTCSGRIFFCLLLLLRIITRFLPTQKPSFHIHLKRIFAT